MTKRKLGRLLLFLPGVLWILAVLWFEGLYSLLLVGLSAVFHECGHLLAFSLLGLPSPRLVPVARGVRFVAPCTLSYREEMFVAAAGPIANFASFLIGILLGDVTPALRAFGDISLLTGLCNLVPVGDLDGERILRCLLAGRLGSRSLYYVGKCVTLAAIFFGTVGSLLVLWQTGGGTYPAFLSIGALLALPCDKKQKEKRGFKSNQEHFKDFS